MMAHRDELSQTIGDEITRIIEEQRELERRYEELITQRISLKVRGSDRAECCRSYILHSMR